MRGRKHYLKKVVPEHRRPKFLKWLEVNLDAVEGADRLALEFETAFDLEVSKGAQMDILGESVGRHRLLDFEPPAGLSPLLDDEMYRKLLRAKIGLNHWDGTMKMAQELLDESFPEYRFYLRDNQDMTMDVTVSGEISVLERAFMSRGYITPKPEGVRVRYEFILDRVELRQNLYAGVCVVHDGAEIRISDRRVRDMDVTGNLHQAGAVTCSLDTVRIPDRYIGGRIPRCEAFIGSAVHEHCVIFIPTASVEGRCVYEQ